MGATITDPLVGRLVDGRYEVVSRIARGGMATVYLAVDRRLDRDVALKVMHPHLAEGSSGADFVARFRREARTAARLTHPGLVGVYDQGVDGETSYLTMEYVDGVNLRRRLGERGALTVGETLDVAASVLDALAAAHRAGLVHRDVKPENVLMATDDRVKLADFGLARAVTEVTATTTGTVLGTVAYLAPELVVRGASDARTDVYACGVLIFEMLTGHQPFTGETPIQVAFQHVNSDIPAPSDQVSWLPIEIDDLVRALAARDPEDRPVDAGAAGELLRRTRAALDEETLDRRADVAPSIVLPAATDPAETDLGTGAVEAGADDEPDDTDATTRLVTDSPGSTVALPIGLAGALATQSAPAPPRRRRRLLRWVAVLLVLVAVVTGGVWWYAALGPGAWTDVPTVAGKAVADAERALVADGLEASSTKAYDDEVPVGDVVSSVPVAGQSVRKGSTVELTVSEGPRYVNVPSGVVGEMQAQADATLVDAGLKPVYAPGEYDAKAAIGEVLSATLPDGSAADPGTRTTWGTEVRLTVSKGRQPVTVTNVVGATLDVAKETFKEAGLKVKTTKEFSHTVPEGTVISQDPKSGTSRLEGDTVKLVVSKGPEPVEVPNVERMGFDEAEQKLTDLGFVVSEKKSWGGFIGQVVDQSVEAGTTAPWGSTIVLTVV
ncbi:Stk1 family PASTA domain-containing Ser/Thr kinase [Cellulomonas rhizosphaerae]|uniref:non-specific serine/threonine protein kinase n=1 Tax=Cellulomonas rhizosphaerae TaxID=2293719 RepID=A0A413RKZ7_9CELL|nr:Stk1 family PASTA domain-containing Ser/Thr kinase [Cellulomonas rhizosphaerae]RHA40285.1 Stk1 family PASTA domain-containing Ser/Thr kinase [Cellulomonas rhizosphaerae]